MDGSERQPVGELHVEREKADVRLCIEQNGEEQEFFLPPERAAQVAMWLNQAATDAKQWQQHEGTR